jgi:ribokinase
MTVDVVCAGSPFLDLIFRGLPRIPGAGEEALATELAIVPGAMANVAFALRQLGLAAVVCAPVGTDTAGRFLQELMADAGVPWIGRPTAATPVSVGLPVDGERAFVTVHPEAVIDVNAIADLRPRAVVANLPVLEGMPTEPWIYGVVGDPQVAILLERAEERWDDLRALIVNEREARNLSGLTDAADAARLLASRGCAVVVTLAESGALAGLPDGRVVKAESVTVDVIDTVGAGDLFAAAFIWADLSDLPIEECLAMATRYASYSLGVPTTHQKGLSLAAYLDAAAATSGPRP